MHNKTYLPPDQFNVKLKNIPPRARLFYVDFVKMSYKAGYCIASDAYLCNYYGVSRWTLYRTLKYLIDNAYVKKFSVKTSSNTFLRALEPLYMPSRSQRAEKEDCGHIQTFFCEDDTGFKMVQCTENGTKSDGDVADLQRPRSNLATSDVADSQQQRSNFATNDVADLQQPRSSFATEDNRRIIKGSVMDKKWDYSTRKREETNATLFGDLREGVLLPNPYKEKEDGYND